MRELMNHIKTGQFKKVYLFFGHERYLARLYEEKVRAKVLSPGMEMMNLDIFEGKDFLMDNVENAINTLPFMCEKRLIILRGTGLFINGRKNDTEKMAGLLASLPDSVLLMFAEPEADKRNKLYKQVVKTGHAVDFVSPSEKELAEWVCRSFKQKNKIISMQDAMFLLRTVAHDMESIDSEIVKLAGYSGESDTITRADIEQICTKALETRIFDLINAIGNRKPETALDIFNNLLLMKESPIMVISMIARQFRLVLQTKLWQEKGLSPKQIAENMGQRSFVITECLKEGRHFTAKGLENALMDCLDADLNIKTGKMADKLAVEVLILKYSGKTGIV